MDAISFVMGEKTSNLRVRKLSVGIKLAVFTNNSKNKLLIPIVIPEYETVKDRFNVWNHHWTEMLWSKYLVICL